MSSQSSVFLLWGAARLPLTSIVPSAHHMSFSEHPESPQRGVIGCIKILGEAKPKILAQLNELGINEKFIYPGLDGVGKYIKKKYSSTNR